MSLIRDVFPLAESITNALDGVSWALENGEPNHLIEAVSPETADLLKFWFQRDYIETRTANFHAGQRDAILAIIYAHEALGTTSLVDLYEKVAKSSLLGGGRYGEITAPRNSHPKYAAKMATGTGKTWVLNALLIWQHLNAVSRPDDVRFTSNFLIVAPGLIVYDRLLDSFLGKKVIGGDQRDFETGDVFAQRDLFIPDNYRASVLGFLRSSVVTKREIGRKITGSGVIALANWHVLAGEEDADFLEGDAEWVSSGADVDARGAASSFLPLTPGTATGNSLEVLDRRFRRGEAMQWLKDLPGLVVFNDEAHHVHSLKKGEEESEVEWQRSLNDLASGKDRRFVQIDFSATPYNEVRKQKQYFPHIVVDFDLMAAMRGGLVKAIALDRRQEVAALANSDLDFSAERDENRKVIGLSEGQRTMLRAGLSKLAILEKQFEQQDPSKHPKMLVMLEDTTVSPFVEEFLRESGMRDEEFLRVDSGRKRDLSPADWEVSRDKLFGIDLRPSPKVVISVLMLREGFDVNNICVIVPLRSSQSGILLEQTIGRGLRLMWRGEESVEELKAETRARIARRQPPTNYYDVLFVVEHPRFAHFYEQELGDLVGEVPDDTARPTGDSERVGLRSGFEAFDFLIPFVVREAEEELAEPAIDVDRLAACSIPLSDLKKFAGTGDTFVSEDLQTNLRFGQFKVDGAKMSAAGYNDYLGKLTTRVANSVDRSFTKAGSLKQNAGEGAILQLQRVVVLRAADYYIRRRFFAEPFDPMHDENWRVLLYDEVSDQLAGNLATALVAALHTESVGSAQVFYRSISEIEWLTVRSSSALAVTKCVYPKLPIPTRSGGLERTFLEWADRDVEVEALVKIHEYRHDFLRRPYLKADGMAAQYSPDFLVRTAEHVYVVETKAQSALSDANVQRKCEAARGWCETLNALPANLRGERQWHYVLLGEQRVKEWRAKGASASALLDFARVRPAGAPEQPALFG